ncbi:type B chloramphenicol O-acetyltransferase [Riemerella anatipestifer]|uniref:type B chloramphenicol O-acetyltransferase n=1 Tax=Riemerella anatipestifer TaxID=34085 RepID=UPI0021D58B92|nr:type B chloramphenicol O-acetyltransferase [Riemerella anatipestifer]MCU7587813.1 type B chloramphenicol O-acetyltransferase [Riemerella anatipestifer]MEE3725201.1 type B chloramphenicol O-acetyltransferase [Riemerella anatipestifer]
MKNFFESPFKGKIIQDHITNPNIIAGKYSYYSGYYHGHSFDDCARYLFPDRDDVDKLIIGSYCSIGSGASFIMAGNQGHRYDWISSFPFYYMSEIESFNQSQDGYKSLGNTIVGNDVWIGSEVMIMPGVKIGDGAVIGSRALVTKDVEPYSIVGGNPAKLIKKRFEDKHIEMLLEIKWWNWDESVLAEAIPLLCSNDIDLLYDFYKKRFEL